MSANLRPNTRLTIAFAFAVGVHDLGDVEIISDSKQPPQYLPTIFTSRNHDGRTTPIALAMHGCRKLPKFSIVLSR
jgi:hypothetical protein